MPIECKLVKRVSKEGNEYTCIEINLTDTYIKRVFLTQAEKELILIQNKK